MKLGCYWNDTGKYQSQYDALWKDLVPQSGKSDTVAGEMIRAAGRLTYDCFNNGMGNNTSGAVNYLLKHGAIPADIHRDIHYFTTGRVLGYKSDSFHDKINRMVDSVVEHIMQNPVLFSQTNTEDMFDLEDEDIELCDGCGEEMEGYSYLCYSCQEQEEYDDEEEEW